MYTQQDFDQNHAQLKKRWIFLAVPAAILLGLVVYSFVVRNETLTITLSLLLAFGFIFGYGMFVSPLAAYERHLNDALKGRTRKVTGAFKSMDESPVMRDGVSYYPMLLSVGDMAKDENDRLFYFDSNIERPNFVVGQTVTVTTHDKFVCDFSVEGEA